MLHPARLSHVFQWRPEEGKSGTEERVEQSAWGNVVLATLPQKLGGPFPRLLGTCWNGKAAKTVLAALDWKSDPWQVLRWGARCGFSTSVPAAQPSVSLTDVWGVLNSYCADQWSEGLWVRHLISGSPYPEGNVEKVAKCSSAVFAHCPGTWGRFRGRFRRRLGVP